MLDECLIDGILSLPRKTYILCITKKHDNKKVQTDPVFTYFVSEIGESRDVYRFDIEQNDLNEAVILYSFFQANKQYFTQIHSDRRCKIQPIEKFQAKNHWCVDRW